MCFWIKRIMVNRSGNDLHELKPKTNKTSIRHEFFVKSIILSAVTLLTFSILFSVILYKKGVTGAYEILRQRNLAVNFFIQGYFAKIRNAVNFLSNIKEVREAPFLDEAARKRVLDIYKFFQLSDSDINYVYSGYENGALLINDYVPPKGFNPVVRPWYVAAIKSSPNVTDGIPYREVKTKKWLVSISKVLLDNEHRITGVVAIDCSVDTISRLLRQKFGGYESAYNYVLKKDGTVIIHHNKSFLGKNIRNILNVPLRFVRKHGRLTYKFNGKEKLAYYSFADTVGWIIVTVLNRSEIIQPIIINILIIVLVISCISFLIAWFFSKSMVRSVITPLVQLESRAGAIIKGDDSRENDYEYPNNEIGRIASNIEQLTEKELYSRNLKLQTINEKLKLLSSIDQLTQLPNRRKMENELKKEWARAQRYNVKFSLILFDIDRFKKINDTFGHMAGDAVLMDIACLLKGTVRSTDFVCRWGGEEFLILCPNTELKEAKELANRLRVTIENHSFSINRRVTISAGVCEYGMYKSIDDMLTKTDEKLYKAKKEGRNRVVA